MYRYTIIYNKKEEKHAVETQPHDPHNTPFLYLLNKKNIPSFFFLLVTQD
jgi:hypothetical protein